MKPEFSTSDLVLALSIVNGTAAHGVRTGVVDSGDTRSSDDGDSRAERAATIGETACRGWPVSR